MKRGTGPACGPGPGEHGRPELGGHRGADHRLGAVRADLYGLRLVSQGSTERTTQFTAQHEESMTAMKAQHEESMTTLTELIRRTAPRP